MLYLFISLKGNSRMRISRKNKNYTMSRNEIIILTTTFTAKR